MFTYANEGHVEVKKYHFNACYTQHISIYIKVTKNL
jgi:hypothetical protein